jgi:hypothetical protein
MKCRHVERRQRRRVWPFSAHKRRRRCKKSQPNTTRKNFIRGVQNLPSRGVLLYATSTTPLVQSYPWRTLCTPRVSSVPVAYNAYATGKYHTRGVQHYGTPPTIRFTRGVQLHGTPPTTMFTRDVHNYCMPRVE